MRPKVNVKWFRNGTIAMTAINAKGEAIHESRMTVADAGRLLESAEPNSATVQVAFYDRPRAVSIALIAEAINAYRCDPR